jgi:hypothetical protein
MLLSSSRMVGGSNARTMSIACCNARLAFSDPSNGSNNLPMTMASTSTDIVTMQVPRRLRVDQGQPSGNDGNVLGANCAPLTLVNSSPSHVL